MFVAVVIIVLNIIIIMSLCSFLFFLFMFLKIVDYVISLLLVNGRQLEATRKSRVRYSEYLIIGFRIASSCLSLSNKQDIT